MRLVLVKAGGATWIAPGSLNGGEVVLLTDQPANSARLTDVFAWDWAQAQ
jgi:hypothetical protein